MAFLLLEELGYEGKTLCYSSSVALPLYLGHISRFIKGKRLLV